MSSLVHIDDANFETEVLKSQVPVLVDFFAEWCSPCKALTPIIEELAKDYAGKFKMGKIDIDHSRGVPSKYGVMMIPTLILFKNGKEIDKVTGFKPKADLRKRIEAALTA
jgi:thioredoxin 1